MAYYNISAPNPPLDDPKLFAVWDSPAAQVEIVHIHWCRIQSVRNNIPSPAFIVKWLSPEFPFVSVYKSFIRIFEIDGCIFDGATRTRPFRRSESSNGFSRIPGVEGNKQMNRHVSFDPTFGEKFLIGGKETLRRIAFY